MGFGLVLVFAQSILGVDASFSDIRQLLADPSNPTATATALFASLINGLADGSVTTPAELSRKLHDYLGYAAIFGAVVLGGIGRMLDRVFKTEW